jgi:hypothetical protein
MNVWYVCLFSICVVLCLGSGLATSLSLAQGVLPSVKWSWNRKSEARAQGGCSASQKNCSHSRPGSVILSSLCLSYSVKFSDVKFCPFSLHKWAQDRLMPLLLYPNYVWINGWIFTALGMNIMPLEITLPFVPFNFLAIINTNTATYEFVMWERYSRILFLYYYYYYFNVVLSSTAIYRNWCLHFRVSI